MSSEWKTLCELNGTIVLQRHTDTGELHAPYDLEGIAAYFEASGTPEDVYPRINDRLRERVAELEAALEAARDTHTISCSECDASFTVYIDEPSIDLSAMEFGWRFRSDEGWACPEHGSWPPTARPDTEEPDDGR